MQLAWWHWLAAGMIIMLFELAVPSFYLLWVGLAAVLVGVLMALLPLTLAWQFFIWALLSILMTALWFRIVKNPNRTRAGQAKENAVGERGLLTRGITELGRGEVLFQRPVLGSDRWVAVADESIPAGERVVVVDVLAQTLKVARSMPAPSLPGSERMYRL